MIPRTGITIDGVSLSYNGSRVLNNIFMEVDKGRVTTLVGPNGCGKTTLLKIINGILPASRGKVYIESMDLRSVKERDLAKLMGYVPQAQRTSFPFTVLDVVLTGRVPHLSTLSQPGKRDIDKAYSALETVGAARIAARAYTQVSGGERQLAMIARALAQEPSYLLLDEPTSYLDFRNQIRILKIIRSLASERRMTVIMTLHDPNHALMFSDKIVLLRKLEGNLNDLSNVVAAGDPGDVMTPEHIRSAYGIDVEIIEINGRRLLFPM